MNHSILDPELIVYHTPHPLALTTLPLPQRHPCHPVLLVAAFKHCLAFSLKQLKSTLGFGFSTATLLLKTIMRCLYFEHFSCRLQLVQDRLCISTLLRYQILLLNIPSLENSTLFHRLLAFESPIP